jgi:hypothetical protein
MYIYMAVAWLPDTGGRASLLDVEIVENDESLPPGLYYSANKRMRCIKCDLCEDPLTVFS